MIIALTVSMLMSHVVNGGISLDDFGISFQQSQAHVCNSVGSRRESFGEQLQRKKVKNLIARTFLAPV